MTAPEHYQKCTAIIEPKDLLQYFPFFLGNAVKYILRYPYKGQAYSDLVKALDYLEWAKERKESPEYGAFYLVPAFKNEILNTLIPKTAIEPINYDDAIAAVNRVLDDVICEEEAKERDKEETF